MNHVSVLTDWSYLYQSHLGHCALVLLRNIADVMESCLHLGVNHSWLWIGQFHAFPPHTLWASNCGLFRNLYWCLLCTLLFFVNFLVFVICLSVKLKIHAGTYSLHPTFPMGYLSITSIILFKIWMGIKLCDLGQLGSPANGECFSFNIFRGSNAI